MKSPLVTIIIPAYNAKSYIRRSLGSALEQTYEKIEIIVVDDGSTDETAEIVKSYGDPRIKYIYQENRGQGAARNNGIKRSSGDYITFLDADDHYLPEKVERQVEFLQGHGEYHAVYCNALHYYSDDPDRLFKKNRKHPSGDIFPDLLHSSLINPNTIMFRRDVLERFRFKEGIHGRYSEEWELYLKIARAGYMFGYIDDDLVVVEIRKDSNTQWDTQWIIKKNTLEMLEGIAAQMSEDDKRRYRIDEILKNNRLKLAVAYLIGRHKKESFDMIGRVYPRIMVYPIMCVLSITPSALLRKYLINLWQKRQRQSFTSV